MTPSRPLSNQALRLCGSAPSPIRPRHKILVLIIVITATTALVSAGYEIATAVGAIAAMGVVAAEISTRLLSPLRSAVQPGA